MASKLSLPETKEAVKNAFINVAPTGLDDAYVPDSEHNVLLETGPSNFSGFEGATWSQDTVNPVNSRWDSAQEDDWATFGGIHQFGLQDDMFGRPEKEQGDKKQQEGIACTQVTDSLLERKHAKHKYRFHSSPGILGLYNQRK